MTDIFLEALQPKPTSVLLENIHLATFGELLCGEVEFFSGELENQAGWPSNEPIAVMIVATRDESGGKLTEDDNV